MENKHSHRNLSDMYRRAQADISSHLKALKASADERTPGSEWPVFGEPWFGKLQAEWGFLNASTPCAIREYLPKNITERFDTVCREAAFLLPETDAVKVFLPVLLISYFTNYLPHKDRTKDSDEQPYNLLIRRLSEQECDDLKPVSGVNERIQSIMDRYLNLPSVLEKYPKLTTDSFSSKNVSRVLPIYLQTIQFLKFLKATRSLCSYRACLWFYDQITQGLSFMNADVVEFLDDQDDEELLSHKRQAYDEPIEVIIDRILDEFSDFIHLRNPEKLMDPENFPPSFWRFLDSLQAFLSENRRRGKRAVNGFLGVLSWCEDVDEDETAEHRLNLSCAFYDAFEVGLEDSKDPAFVEFLIKRLEKYEDSPNVSRAIYRAFEDYVEKSVYNTDRERFESAEGGPSYDVDTQEFEDFYIKRLMEYDQSET